MKKIFTIAIILLTCLNVMAGGMKGNFISDEAIAGICVFLVTALILSFITSYAYRRKSKQIYLTITILCIVPFFAIGIFILALGSIFGLVFFIPVVANILIVSNKKGL